MACQYRDSWVDKTKGASARETWTIIKESLYVQCGQVLELKRKKKIQKEPVIGVLPLFCEFYL